MTDATPTTDASTNVTEAIINASMPSVIAVPTQELEVLNCFTVLDDGSMAQESGNGAVAIKIEQVEELEGGNLLISSTSGNFTSVTLADGTEALVAHEVAVEEQVAVEVQAVEEKVPQYNTVIVQGLPKYLVGQTITLEDGSTAMIHAAPRGEKCQPVALEDGTTAYITLPDHLLSSSGDESTKKHSQQNQQKEYQEDQEQTEIQITPAEESRPKCFMCNHEGCGKLYTTLHHLRVHERTHTGDRPFRCTVRGCDKAFATGYGRKAHIRTHTGEKPYRCPEDTCKKAFKTSGDLQKHLRTHTGERPFTCPVAGCGRSFTTSNIRKVHVRTHTGERPYVCNVEGCTRAFASATNFKNHLRIHSGEKPYVCSIKDCGKRFTEYSSLYKHHMVHTQLKPYLCGVCGRHYRQASTLTMHKRTAHGIVEVDDGTEIFLGDRVLEFANTESVTKGKKAKTFAGVKKDGSTLVAIQTPEDPNNVDAVQGTTSRLVFVTDAVNLADLEQFGVQAKEAVTEETCHIQMVEDESSNSISA